MAQNPPSEGSGYSLRYVGGGLLLIKKRSRTGIHSDLVREPPQGAAACEATSY